MGWRSGKLKIRILATCQRFDRPSLPARRFGRPVEGSKPQVAGRPADLELWPRILSLALFEGQASIPQGLTPFRSGFVDLPWPNAARRSAGRIVGFG